MNHYGAMMQTHWRRHRPHEYATMTNRETFFANLGEEVQRLVQDREAELEEAVPADLAFQDRLERMRAARSTAERQVLAEMLPVAEDHETGE